MNVLSTTDGELVARVIARLVANGFEANRLRSLLLIALIDAAHLSGDKAEASKLVVQLEQLAAEWRR